MYRCTCGDLEEDHDGICVICGCSGFEDLMEEKMETQSDEIIKEENE